MKRTFYFYLRFKNKNYPEYDKEGCIKSLTRNEALHELKKMWGDDFIIRECREVKGT